MIYLQESIEPAQDPTCSPWIMLCGAVNMYEKNPSEYKVLRLGRSGKYFERCSDFEGKQVKVIDVYFATIKFFFYEETELR